VRNAGVVPVVIGRSKKGYSVTAEAFNNGTYITYDMNLAVLWANRISSLKSYFDKYNSGMFIRSMIVLFKNDKFDWNVFIRKLEMHKTGLLPQTKINDYHRMHEENYNSRTREENKVRFF
jgi:hypothetical protein